jgi:hypothetical protein
MKREEPSLETLWLKNIGAVDKVQNIDRSNTAPSSKIFRNEFNSLYLICLGKNKTILKLLKVVTTKWDEMTNNVNKRLNIPV